ncbi:MAG: DEAD/DEAH box helicase [Pseudomonadales bacterium]|nr:DEAD/DEAH box helicase [Pseudomonadales bacterium]MBO6565881.1 DEAD/DEAH box helicase [Pseudomonadales bacterium]MBO6595568.1 DEAD/DEAH box helicase [Pseudomonadales bacterium]MBO6820874.1 DEAD/DEAH box helicase [Pseudomonadales bacterium]
MLQFHPIIQQWFDERYGAPTDIQSMSWPRIAERENLLITAPTGSGKTLTAFLWTLNRFATGELKTGATRVLYISPLKALNNDIRKNLLDPLSELNRRFEREDEALPRIGVSVRSGDTEPEARRRMLRQPPEILITTPESLNIMLSSRGGLNILQDIDTVILDEIHAVVDSKRGVYLMSAIERLASMNGEFQRIALSATVNPLETVAEFVGGFERTGDDYKKRNVEILASNARKTYDISIRYPENAANRGEDEKIWDYLAEDLLPKIQKNNSTLIFTNSRALCEKLTYKINMLANRMVAYAHHGSLAREIRTEVEQRLKDGALEAIVATSSLEMGIDIGALDEVVLVQSPGSIASTIQRIGRAGHQVGAASRCTIYPTHPQDFVEAAVLASAVKEKALEPVKTIHNPLDVLGQVIISMTGTEAWDLDELFAEVKRPTAYNDLTRREFDLVINMLLGRYADHHIRELKPRIRVDRMNNTVEARKGALLSLYLSGGVIPDRGYFQLRHETDNAKIGELDEEFVWEARVGQVFSLGTQSWQVRKITHNDVIVGPAKPGTSAPPFWRAESINRSFHYAERINEFLEAANDEIHDPAFKDKLIEEYCAEPRVAEEIVTYLKRQQDHAERPLPHRHHLMVEKIRSGPMRATGYQLVLHTGWGAEVNRPLALALEAAWEEKYGEEPEVFVANESVVLQLPHEVSAAEILELVPSHRLEELLRKRLEGSGFFGARFRENAGRSLLLSKGRFNERKPLWMSRLQSQKLLDSVLKYEDFPVLLETWRTCLRDEFDMDHLRQMLHEIETREIVVSEVDSATPSPFAQAVAHGQIMIYMYMNDAPKSGSKTSKLREDLLQEVVFTPGMRPGIARHIIDEFTTMRQRQEEGYLPQDMTDLIDWVGERSAIPIREWQTLSNKLDFEINDKAFASIQGDQLIVTRDDEARFTKLLQHDDEGFSVFMSNLLQYYGPISSQYLCDTLKVDELKVRETLDELTDANALVLGELILDDENAYYCDADNYEYLLRLQRARGRPRIEAKPGEALPAFMHGWQTRYSAYDPLDKLYECMERLRGMPLSAGLWESEVIPARLNDYHCSQLDLLFQEGDLLWLGSGEKNVLFSFIDELDMVLPTSEEEATSQYIDSPHARYDFSTLLEMTGESSATLAEGLWQEAWNGTITNDSFAALRKGIQNDFRVEKVEAPNATQMRRSRRGAFNRWRGSMPFAGNWHLVNASTDSLDLLEQQEQNRELARLMLDRWGIVFREICERESDAFNWRTIFRTLRLMELSGEVVSGHFFKGIPGPQYMTPTALRFFQEPREENAKHVFFLNAADPISPSGLGLGIHGEQLPRRIPSNYLVYDGEELVLLIGKRGKELNFLVEPIDEKIDQYLKVLHHMMYRPFDPARKLTIETINGEPAVNSPYLTRIEESFNIIRDYKNVTIQREL